MSGSARSAIDLGSQDLGVDDLVRFRDKVLERTDLPVPHTELVVISDLSGVSQYIGLDEVKGEGKMEAKEPIYLYYTISWPSKARCSLYIDPDRPARLVLEGPKDWRASMEREVIGTIGVGDSRYRIHGGLGFLTIWLSVMAIATLFVLGYVLGSGENDPVIIIPVIVSSGLLGIYLSLVKLKELQPANTISLSRRKRWWVESVLNLLVVALGIISAIMASFLVRYFLD